MVLTALISEFRLQEKICSRYYTGAIRGGQPPSYSGFEVMPSLVGCVDAPKAHAKREFGERWSAVFFPGGAVKKIGDERSLLAWHRVILPRSRSFEPVASTVRFEETAMPQKARHPSSQGRRPTYVDSRAAKKVVSGVDQSLLLV